MSFGIGAMLFWLMQLSLQWFWLSEKLLGPSLIRSFGVSAAFLISFSLFSSCVFKWIPRLAIYWRIRRYLGVSGFIFAVFHVWSAYHFYFNYDVAAVYWSLNPLKNPVIFSSIAFPILLVMTLTSTDWAMTALTPKIWKTIHRFVYLAYWGVVFHFLLINPALLKNPVGYSLMVVIALTLAGEFFWFIKIVWLRRGRTWGLLVGIFIIALYILTAYFALRNL